MKEFDIAEFLRIIEDEGCKLLDLIILGDERVQWALSRNGNRKVAISVTDDTMSYRTTRDLLIKLELDDLIERLGVE